MGEGGREGGCGVSRGLRVEQQRASVHKIRGGVIKSVNSGGVGERCKLV